MQLLRTNIARGLSIDRNDLQQLCARFHKRWWQKYNYVQYVALDAGHTF